MKDFISILVTWVLCLCVVHGARRKCEAEVTDKTTGTIKSPGFPTFHYPNRYTCWYTIKAPAGEVVELTFTHFELEPPIGDRKTDYVRIFDGRKIDRKQVVDFVGTKAAPFTFVSLSNHVVVRLTTNRMNTRKGFSATYRTAKPRVYCDQLYLPFGTAQCHPAGSGGLFSYCNVTCDLTFVVEGNVTTYCDDGQYEYIPACNPDPDLAEFCAKDILNPGCPFPPELLAEYYSTRPEVTSPDVATEAQFTALFDEAGDEFAQLNETTSLQFGRSQTKTYSCPSKLCDYDSSLKKFKYNCRQLALALQKKYKLSAAATKKRMIHCFSCQTQGCTVVAIFN